MEYKDISNTPILGTFKERSSEAYINHQGKQDGTIGDILRQENRYYND
jgi:hypothetical protein